MGEECLDWAKLPNDCVNLISRRLIDTFDLMSFRWVCKSWFNAIPPEKQLKFPLLLVARHGERESAECEFYSIMSNKIFTVHRPEALNKFHSWQAGGYLGMLEEAGDGGYFPSLLNPVTGAQLSLHHVTGSCSTFFPLNVGENPIENSNEVVISFYSREETGYMSYWDKTSSDWVIKKDFPHLDSFARAFYKGRVFTCSKRFSCTKVTQVEGGADVIHIAFPDDVTDFSCLVQVKEDLIGIVERNVSSQLEETFFEAYKLDEEITPPRWIKINSIGENMIFLNYRSHAFSISSSHFDDERIKGNSIYFTKWNMQFFLKERTNQIGICQLGDNFSKILGTGPPDLVSLTWIIPNFS